MRRFLSVLCLGLSLALVPLASSAEGLGTEGETIVRELLNHFKVAGKVGKKTVGRGGSGALRSLLMSSDKVICGIWQAKQHNLMIELAVTRAPAEVYRKAQRLGEIIDRVCDKVVNPEGYATGGGGSSDPDEGEEEDASGSPEPEEPTDPQVICENQCLLEYSAWRRWVRDLVKWERWVREAEESLKGARAANREAARTAREAKATAKAARAEAERLKGEAENAGWPASSIDSVGSALQNANRKEAAARRAMTAWRKAYAKAQEAKEDLASWIHVRDTHREEAAKTEAAYRACVKRCLAARGHASALTPAGAGTRVRIGTLRRFQTTDPHRASIAPVHTRPILALPGRERLRQRIAQPLAGGYAARAFGHRGASHTAPPVADGITVAHEEPVHRAEDTAPREPERRADPRTSEAPALEPAPRAEGGARSPFSPLRLGLPNESAREPVSDGPTLRQTNPVRLDASALRVDPSSPPVEGGRAQSTIRSSPSLAVDPSPAPGAMRRTGIAPLVVEAGASGL
ncbi:MAG: hypothetical protein GY937_13620 [bacterium]|nr:hypothetical protein [bacterium]